MNHRLALVVEGRGGHVQQQDARIPDQRPSDGDALLLPAAHLTATLPHQRLKFLPSTEKVSMRLVPLKTTFLCALRGRTDLRQIHDEVVGVGLLGSGDDVLHGDARSAVAYVLSYGRGKQHGLLLHDADQ